MTKKEKKMKLPKATIYISTKELKRVNELLQNELLQAGEKLMEVRISGFVGYHDIDTLFAELKKFKVNHD